MRDMDDILSNDLDQSGSDLPDGPEVETQAPEVEASETPAETSAPEADPATDGGHDDLGALKRSLAASREERKQARRERQEAREEAARLRGELEAMRRAQEPTADPSSDVDSFYGDPTQYINARVDAAVAAVRQEAYRRAADNSERRARRDHEDYEEAKAAFVEMAKQPGNEYMWTPVANSSDPAAVVYEHGKRLLGDKSTADKDARIAELEARIAEIESGGGSASRPSIPKSNATARGSGPKIQGTWAGPRSMDDILA